MIGLVIVRAIATFPGTRPEQAGRQVEILGNVDSPTVLAGLAVVGAVGIQSSISMRTHAEVLRNPSLDGARDEFLSAMQHYVITQVAAGFTLLVTVWQILRWDVVTAGAGLLLCWVLSVQATHGLLREPRVLAEERRNRRLDDRRVITRRHAEIRASARTVRSRLVRALAFGALAATLLPLTTMLATPTLLGLAVVDLYLVAAAVLGGYFSLDARRLWRRGLFFVVVTALMGLTLFALILEEEPGLVKTWPFLAALTGTHYATLALLAVGLCGIGPVRDISSHLLALQARRMSKRWALLEVLHPTPRRISSAARLSQTPSRTRARVERL